jgi:rhodanese-related sulfurtransferase
MNKSDTPSHAISAQTLKEMLQGADKPVIVDVRSAEEFASGHVDGAVNIPHDQLAGRATELPKDAQIVTVCNYGGARSCGAADALRDMGFEKAAPLEGGTKGWPKDPE